MGKYFIVRLGGAVQGGKGGVRRVQTQTDRDCYSMQFHSKSQQIRVWSKDKLILKTVKSKGTTAKVSLEKNKAEHLPHRLSTLILKLEGKVTDSAGDKQTSGTNRSPETDSSISGNFIFYTDGNTN